MKSFLIIILSFSPFIVFSEEVSQSSKGAIVADSLVQPSNSIHAGIKHRLDSIESGLKYVQTKLDSLNHLDIKDTIPLKDSLKQALAKGQTLQQKLKEQHNIVDAPLVETDAVQQILEDRTSPVAKANALAQLQSDNQLPKIDSPTFSGQNIDQKVEQHLLKQNEVANQRL